MDEIRKKIIVDAGHGGIDGGAAGNNLLEKDLNLQVSNYMYERFKELGIPVQMTRTSDEYLPKTERVNKVKDIYNDDSNVILISNHINAGGGEGAEVVYALRNSPLLAQNVLESIGDAGQIKRKVYQRRLPENPNKDYYYILRETGNLEPILIEYGFIDNVNDAKKLKSNLNDYAEAVVKAVSQYAGYTYIPKDYIIEEGTYIVQKGDTLYSISKKLNIAVDKLKELNNLKNNTIVVGQKLNINDKQTIEPNYPLIPNEDEYIVQKGDTLYSISSKYGISIDKIKKINNLETNILSIGQKLFLNEDMNQSDYYEDYIVEKGDSLWSISQKYKITVNELIDINNLANITLQIGQVLKVPKQNVSINNEKIYIVQKGDTLWSISKKLNVRIDKIKKLNNLKNNLLSIGQQLKIKNE